MTRSDLAALQMKRVRRAFLLIPLLAVAGCANRFPPYPSGWSPLQTPAMSCRVLAGRYLNRTETDDIFGAEEARVQAGLWGLLVGARSQLSQSQIVEIRTADPAAVEIIAWSPGPIVEELGRMKMTFGVNSVACDKGIWTIKSAINTRDVLGAAMRGQEIGDLQIGKTIDGSLIVKEQLNGIVFYPGGLFGNSPQQFIWGHRWLRFRPEELVQ